MKPLQFYRKYLSNNDLIRANIGLEGMDMIRNLEELAQVLTFRSEDGYFLELVVEVLTEGEMNLIKRLHKTTTLTQYYTLDYKPSKYPGLTDFVLLIEDKNGKGVLQRSVVEELMKFIFDEEELFLSIPDEELETGSEYLDKLPEHVRNLVYGVGEEATLKNELEMYPVTGLKTITGNLNFAVDSELGQTEELVIYHVLTDPDLMDKALVSLPYDAVVSLQKAVDNDDRYFKVNGKTEALFHFGISGDVDNHGYIYPEVFKALKKMNLKRLAAITKSGISIGAYNAMRVKVTLKDAHVPIERELIIPARLNFFEFHLVIQRAMGWWTSHLAHFKADKKMIHMYGLDDIDTRFGASEMIDLNGIDTMVDSMLLEHTELTYLYDYGDDWEHEVELMELLQESSPVYPSVDKRKGPVPIEDSGGVHGLEETMKILNDENHPEHEDISLWVRSTNYRKTYQKKQINKKLQELFSGGLIITKNSLCKTQADVHICVHRLFTNQFNDFSSEPYNILNNFICSRFLF